METNPNFLTKNKFAYDRLKESIIRGEFKPGDRLIISNLAKLLKISIIPIREALATLKTEGLVTHIPHAGVIVSSINYDEIKENYIIRSELEGITARYATEHLTDLDFKMLQKNIDQMKKVIGKKEFSKCGPINKEFHRIIYKACPYKKLYKMIFDLWNDIERIQSVFALVPQRTTSSLHEHIDILNALKKRDANYVESLIKKQKQLAWKDLETYFNSNEPETSN